MHQWFHSHYYQDDLIDSIITLEPYLERIGLSIAKSRLSRHFADGGVDGGRNGKNVYLCCLNIYPLVNLKFQILILNN